MKKIGITGGIGSGKTTVCKIFESLDIPVYYADIEAKRIISRNALVKKQIKDLIGEGAFHKNGLPNRKYIASKIFTDKKLLQKINEIVHPAVQADTERWTEQIKATSQVPYVLKEAALLVENGSFKAFDALIVVTCPEDIRIKRVMTRDKSSYEAVRKKASSQWPESEKVRVADFIINNDGNTALIPQVWEIHQKLI
ncbi:MAG: dephospho-CoA kinase [Saprospiraceae bacterium]